ncbi:hypothetical protein [Photobacterium leiognathi]|uniref:hypothetical protein n=1 Tax=Photobacterium leiognathi TaxID=553611 RepID=UPI002981DDF2|nr:hypothetical protein [Photobacterium leiognathi]
MKKIFLSFADSRMSSTLNRICKQAKGMKIYDEIIVADEGMLFEDFKNEFKDKLKKDVRGYGYWCWKPQIILQILETMNDGDILQYTDAGCHLNRKGRNKLEEYFKRVNNSDFGLLVFQSYAPQFHDGRVLCDLSVYKYIKSDLLEYMGMLNQPSVLTSPMIEAGVIFIKKTPQTVKIIKKWLSVYKVNFDLASDSPSKIENVSGFIEHRHDQAIFTLICMNEKIETCSAYEYWYPKPPKADWRALKYSPILAKRDKNLGVFHFLGRIFNRIKRMLLNN